MSECIDAFVWIRTPLPSRRWPCGAFAGRHCKALLSTLPPQDTGSTDPHTLTPTDTQLLGCALVISSQTDSSSSTLRDLPLFTWKSALNGCWFSLNSAMPYLNILIQLDNEVSHTFLSEYTYCMTHCYHAAAGKISVLWMVYVYPDTPMRQGIKQGNNFT